ncbi:hypothetical protein F8M41_005121 [Gigaspora margarita]|uniref:Uncharacterized protein n=1 Tax=Gigaspora margarita TaxID=4874 RepID=A0A8H3X9X0_GIGMA|nr:hypothetical protein F8M41_005121 [Gigaspora margarita]
MKGLNRTTCIYTSLLKFRVKSKKIKYEVEETFASDEVSEYSNTENISLPSEESSVEETKIISNTNYILLETSLVNTMEVSIDYKESDMDSIYEIMNNEQLPDNTEASIDSYESDETNVEDSTNDMLEDMSSEFKGFDSKYGLYFSNFTSAIIFIWITKHIISTSAYKDFVKILTYSEY